MNLKTILFITLFLYAVVLTHQATSDAPESAQEPQAGDSLADKARLAKAKVVEELKLQAKMTREEFHVAKKKLMKESQSQPDAKPDVSDTSDSDSWLEKAMAAVTSTGDSAKAAPFKALQELREKTKQAKEAYRSAKASLKSTGDSAVDQAMAAERKAVDELKQQARNAKEQFKSAFKKLKGTRTSSTDNDDTDDESIIKKGIEEAASDTAKAGEWKAVSELRAQAQKAKEAYSTAKTALKSKFKKSDDASDSSDSSDDDSVVDKAKHAVEWKAVTELKDQAKKAKEAAKGAYKKLMSMFTRSEESSDSSDSSESSDSTDNVKETVKDKVEDKVEETVKEKAQEGAEGLLHQAREAQKNAYLELKDGARRAKEAFKTAYRDLKNRIRGESAKTADATTSETNDKKVDVEL